MPSQADVSASGSNDLAGVGRPVTGLPWRAAWELAHTLGRPVGAEQVALHAAYGRVVAVPLRAAATVPGFDAAAMDGYAVAGPGPWRIRLTTAGMASIALAGHSGTDRIAAGMAIEIATGAAVPTGTEAVLPYERCQLTGDVVIGQRPGQAHIRRVGEDFRHGDLLADVGHVATAALIGLAANAGLDALTVRRRPTVRVLITGDEVVRLGVPGDGQVRDAFEPMLAALLEHAGAVVTAVEPVPDDHGALETALRSEPVDVVVVTGSSSMGRADHLRPVLRAMPARVHVDGVACRPGHPQLLAETPDGTWVVGLPGNPYAGLVGYLSLLEPLLYGLLARERRPTVALTIDGDVRPLRDGTRLIPVRLDGDHATVVAGARPASLRAAAAADGVAVIEPTWARDEATDVLLLP